jgi:methionyl-tRNA formyltransferase
MAERRRVIFFGSGAFGVPTLRELAAHHELRAIVTQPDKPAGRGHKLTPTPIAQWAAEHAPGVMVLKPENVNEAGMLARVREIDADAWVVIAFGQKLSRGLLEGRFAVNLHASLLPRWRGAAPIHSAILAGDAQTGNSVITLAEKMDAGLILGQSRREISPGATTGELHDQLAGDGAALILRVLEEQALGTLVGREQDPSLVTLARKLSKGDAWMDPREGAEACRRRVHGLNPWPGVVVRLGELELKLLRVRVSGTTSELEAGRVVDQARGLVSCGTGACLELLEVQPAGKRAMTWLDFVRGRPVREGEVLIGGRPC